MPLHCPLQYEAAVWPLVRLLRAARDGPARVDPGLAGGWQRQALHPAVQVSCSVGGGG